VAEPGPRAEPALSHNRAHCHEYTKNGLTACRYAQTEWANSGGPDLGGDWGGL